MTNTSKPVQRVSVNALIRDGGKNRQVIARLGPDDYIYIRLKGTRRPWMALELKELAWTAIRRTANQDYLVRRAKAKAEGKRAPRKPVFPRS